MHKLIVGLVGLIFTSSAALADDIVVLRGTGRLVLDAQSAVTIPPSIKAYFVVNYTDGTVAQILYFNKLGKKKLVTTNQLRFTQITLPNSKSATVITTGSTSDLSSTDFRFNTILLRGTDVALLIETSPAKRTIARPRSFVGDSLYVLANAGSPSVLQNLKLTFAVDVAKTIEANNNDSTVAQTRDAIDAALAGQGYEDLVL